jgi:hypothetical protein
VEPALRELEPSRIGGASANALTSDALADLGGGSRLHDVWVDVGRAPSPATA